MSKLDDILNETVGNFKRVSNGEVVLHRDPTETKEKIKNLLQEPLSELLKEIEEL